MGNLFSSLAKRDSLALTSESALKVVVKLLKFMQSGRLFPRRLLLTIRSLWMRLQRKKSKTFLCSTIVRCWWLIPDAVNPRNLEVQVPEPDTRNLTVNLLIFRFFMELGWF